jgi:NADPH:quinone reductase-like Zn-dependent oxidoreductase
LPLLYIWIGFSLSSPFLLCLSLTFQVVFDTVGGETLQRSWAVLKPGGRMITIAADSEYTTDDRVKQAFFIVEPNHTQLTQIGSLLEAGDLRPVVDAVLPLTRASEAYTGELKAPSPKGEGFALA